MKRSRLLSVITLSLAMVCAGVGACFWIQLIRQRTFGLWWHAGSHAAREESQFVELTSAGFEMATPRCLVASLGALKDGGNVLQVTMAMVSIKQPRAQQGIGGV